MNVIRLFIVVVLYGNGGRDVGSRIFTGEVCVDDSNIWVVEMRFEPSCADEQFRVSIPAVFYGYCHGFTIHEGAELTDFRPVATEPLDVSTALNRVCCLSAFKHSSYLPKDLEVFERDLMLW